MSQTSHSKQTDFSEFDEDKFLYKYNCLNFWVLTVSVVLFFRSISLKLYRLQIYQHRLLSVQQSSADSCGDSATIVGKETSCSHFRVIRYRRIQDIAVNYLIHVISIVVKVIKCRQLALNILDFQHLMTSICRMEIKESANSKSGYAATKDRYVSSFYSPYV